MEKNLLKTISRAALAILMLAVFAQTPVFAQEQVDEEQSDAQKQEDASSRSSRARRLEGVWNLTVTGRDCQTGAVIRTGPAILTFARGGTMHDFGSGRPPATRSAGYGVWSYQSNRRYTDAFQFFLYNPDGTLAGRQIVREQILLSHDGNSFTNSAETQILDVNGNVISNRCSTGVATRFQ